MWGWRAPTPLVTCPPGVLIYTLLPLLLTAEPTLPTWSAVALEVGPVPEGIVFRGEPSLFRDLRADSPFELRANFAVSPSFGGGKWGAEVLADGVARSDGHTSTFDPEASYLRMLRWLGPRGGSLSATVYPMSASSLVAGFSPDLVWGLPGLGAARVWSPGVRVQAQSPWGHLWAGGQQAVVNTLEEPDPTEVVSTYTTSTYRSALGGAGLLLRGRWLAEVSGGAFEQGLTDDHPWAWGGSGQLGWRSTPAGLDFDRIDRLRLGDPVPDTWRAGLLPTPTLEGWGGLWQVESGWRHHWLGEGESLAARATAAQGSLVFRRNTLRVDAVFRDAAWVAFSEACAERGCVSRDQAWFPNLGARVSLSSWMPRRGVAYGLFGAWEQQAGPQGGFTPSGAAVLQIAPGQHWTLVGDGWLGETWGWNARVRLGW